MKVRTEPREIDVYALVLARSDGTWDGDCVAVPLTARPSRKRGSGVRVPSGTPAPGERLAVRDHDPGRPAWSQRLTAGAVSIG